MTDFMKDIILGILASGLLSTILSTLISSAQHKSIISGGLKHVLYFQIKQCCKEAIRDGVIDDDSLQALHEAWEIYHDKLGGNGYLTALMSRVDKLPLTENEEH